MVRLTTGSIAVEAFSCQVCAKPLAPPIFECSGGHFFCSSCRDGQLPEEKCKFCSGGCLLALSHGMNRAVKYILVDCRNAKHGCREKLPWYKESPNDHEAFCPHAPCKCPEHGCGFAGTAAAELLDHLTGEHRWPSVMFEYWVPFDLRVVRPGAHVLHCKNDGQLFLLSVQPAVEPPGLAVSLVSVRYTVPPKDDPSGCSVSFKCSERHRSTSTLDSLWPWCHFGWPPTEYICFVPKVSDGPDDAGIVLTINIISADAAGKKEDPDDDSSYVESDEDGDDSSS